MADLSDDDLRTLLAAIDPDTKRLAPGFRMFARAAIAADRALNAPQAAPVGEPVEMSPEFTDTARAALLWVLWHHQGASSPVGQPIRFALGMGGYEHLNERQVTEAKRWAAISKSATEDFHRDRAAPVAPAEPMTACPHDVPHRWPCAECDSAAPHPATAGTTDAGGV